MISPSVQVHCPVATELSMTLAVKLQGSKDGRLYSMSGHIDGSDYHFIRSIIIVIIIIIMMMMMIIIIIVVYAYLMLEGIDLPLKSGDSKVAYSFPALRPLIFQMPLWPKALFRPSH